MGVFFKRNAYNAAYATCHEDSVPGALQNLAPPGGRRRLGGSICFRSTGDQRWGQFADSPVGKTVGPRSEYIVGKAFVDFRGSPGTMGWKIHGHPWSHQDRENLEDRGLPRRSPDRGASHLLRASARSLRALKDTASDQRRV